MIEPFLADPPAKEPLLALPARLVQWLELLRREVNSPTAEQSWGFLSPAGSTGTFYFGGDYRFHSAAFTPAGGTNVGVVNASYAAHALMVLGASSTDMVVRVTGTSITDAGVRTASDTEDLDTSGGSADDYYETEKKWIGQISYSLQSGTGVTIDAGFCKYWDYQNTAFIVVGLEVLWLGGATDTDANIELLHHRATGWTYDAGGSPAPPAAIAGMNADHGAEQDVINGEPGAWKRDNLSEPILGSRHEGVLWRITTGANKAFEQGSLQIYIDYG